MARPGHDGGTPITGYQIESKVGDASWQVAIADTGHNHTSATIQDLSTTAPTQFRIAALNAVGTSEASQASPVVTGIPRETPTARRKPPRRPATAGWSSPGLPRPRMAGP